MPWQAGRRQTGTADARPIRCLAVCRTSRPCAKAQRHPYHHHHRKARGPGRCAWQQPGCACTCWPASPRAAALASLAHSRRRTSTVHAARHGTAWHGTARARHCICARSNPARTRAVSPGGTACAETPCGGQCAQAAARRWCRPGPRRRRSAPRWRAAWRVPPPLPR